MSRKKTPTAGYKPAASGKEKPVNSADDNGSDPLDGFSPATRDWFLNAFPAPTPVQAATWTAVAGGTHTLASAPTGSGKTLAAFLLAIDRLYQEKTAEARQSHPAAPATRILYVSPLKALGADVARNLDLPLSGVARMRQIRGDGAVEITVGMRTGDTPASGRAALIRRPPDILITTPESLYLMLTSKARETLRRVDTVIVDEVHAVAGTKRGAHLALTLERLDALLPRPARRIGLSATVRPVKEVASFLGGVEPVTVVNPPLERRLNMRIVVPVEDMTNLTVPSRPDKSGSIWFHVESAVLAQVLTRRSTIVFVNSRGLAERMTARLNELYAERFDIPPEGEADSIHYLSSNGGTEGRTQGFPSLIARAHHGSVSKERRADIEQSLKSGELRCVVATSSLELGIDMGQVDQVIQVAPPPSVASGLQRVGRSAHHVGGTPSGLVYPRTRRDLVDAAVTVENMLAGSIEAVYPPQNPLDILAQQTVAAVAMDSLHVDDWFALVRRAAPFRSISRRAFEAVLDMLAGRFPSHEFAEFRPRLVWNRVSGLLSARPGAQRLAVVNGGTIPDRGAFTVILPEGEEQTGSRRVGELDEEMVFESRVNDVIALGASTWRIREITNDQVVVVPAPGKSARLPFWHGEGPGRPAELGAKVGAFLRAVDQEAEDPKGVNERLLATGLDRAAAENLLALLAEQRAATGTLPTDRVLVMERCKDELGDWRLMLHSPYGRRVHAPWALAVAGRIRERYRVDAAVVASDDGIVARVPETLGHPPGAELFAFGAEGIRDVVTAAVGNSALFAARFRECASRALLLPRRSPGKRSPLWQQRLRAGQLLEVAREYPDFPILLETARECLRDVYDLPALQELMEGIANGGVCLRECVTETPSPFAANLLFGYVGEFMYDDDIPLAEKRASLLSLDLSLLAELLGHEALGQVLDPAVVEDTVRELQRMAPGRKALGLEGVADLLRELGPLSAAEVARRLAPMDSGDSDQDALPAEAAKLLAELVQTGRAIRLRIGEREQWAAVEDASRLRDALGVRLPHGIPPVFLEAADDPLRDLVVRFARTHGPFSTAELADRLGLGAAVAKGVLERLRDQGRLLHGSFSPDSQAGEIAADSYQDRKEWLWEDVFRRLRNRSLKAAREAVKPVDQAAYARLLLERQSLLEPDIGGTARPLRAPLRGLDGVARVVEQLSGLPLPASLWERAILPSRVGDYQPGMLDELLARRDVIWTGSGRMGDSDGLVALHLADLLPETLPLPPADEDFGDDERAILEFLEDGGGYFARQIAGLLRRRVHLPELDPASPLPPETRSALWNLAWAGRISTDTFAALRGLSLARASRPAPKSRTVRRRVLGSTRSYSFSGMGTSRRASAPEDPSLAGRWSLVPREELSETGRALAGAEGLLDRYGIITRSSAVAEKVAGGFPAIQRVLRSMEDAGQLLRGRFVLGMGAAQFAENSMVNRLRELAEPGQYPALALAAIDPANPFGALLPWPRQFAPFRPNRRAGAVVVIHNGSLVIWLSPGGRSLLAFPPQADDPATIQDSVDAASLDEAMEELASFLHRSGAARFTLERINDQAAAASPLAQSLRRCGFAEDPKGLSWYRRIRG